MTKREWSLVAFMALLCVAAFGVNPLLFRDRVPPGTPEGAVERLEAPLSSGRDGVHPRWVQVVEVSWTGEPDSTPVGVVVYRTLFGIPVGRDEFAGGRPHYHIMPGRWAAVWASFLLAEGVLGAYLIRRIGWG